MQLKLEQSKTYSFGTARKRPMQKRRLSTSWLARFWKDDRGEYAIEFLMILTFGVLPLITTVFLLEDILREYVAFGQIFVSSPFF